MEKTSHLTSSQNGVYFENYQNPERTMYNLPICYRFEKGIDANRLYEAVKKICSKYEVFALTIRNIDGTFYNIVNEEKRTQYIHERLKLHPTVSEDEIKKVSKNYLHHFKLENSPLYYIDIYPTENAVYLFTDIHHAIWDGTSIAIFEKALKSAYENEELPDELISYEQLLADEKELEKNGTKQADFEYYEKLLDGNEAEGILCGDLYDKNSDSADNSKSIKEYVYESSVEEEKLVSFAKANGVTENAVLINSFAYLLSIYNCSDEAIFSTVTAARRSAEYKSKLGMLVKSFPFYSKFNEDQNIVEMLKQNSEVYKQSLIHSTVDFGRLVNELHFSSEINFVFQGLFFDSFEIDGSKCTTKLLFTDDSISDFVFFVLKQNGKYFVQLDYNASKYSETFIKSFVGAYQKVIEGFLQKTTLKEIEFTDDEAFKLFESFKGKSVKVDENHTVLDLIRNQIKNHPEHTAVVFNEKRISYKELDLITGALASKISSFGIEENSFVSILIHRSHFMPLCSFGVLRTGAAYQPLDPSYPKERLNYMMKDAGAKLLICDRDLRSLVDEYDGNVIFTDEIELDCTKILKQNQNEDGTKGGGNGIFNCADIKGEDAFIILYTSGTTGVPKGVVLEHRNLAAIISYQLRVSAINQNTKYAAYASYGFDANMLDTYPVLCGGGELHILDEEIRLDLGAIEKYFKKNQITHAFMTTQVGRAFAEMTDCESLKYLSTGGEKLVPLKFKKDLEFINIYGPTECAIYVTSATIASGQNFIPIGKPNDNLILYIVDKNNRLLPYGAKGELCVSGPQVGRSYLNLPEKTASAFVKNPFMTNAPYDKMYKTGDICSWLEDGSVAIAGRNDGQVKVRGFRIELTEVEKIIREFKDVKDATVIAVDSPAGGKMLAAYIVSDKKIEKKALADFILSTKPPYMVPSSIMQIEKIPLNVNSKVDKRKLPPPVFEEEEIVPPSTDVQKKICAVVSELLGISQEKISINAHLASYGLTSIAMLKLNVMLGKLFDVPLKTSELKENNTVSLIEKLLLSKKKPDSFVRLKDYPLTMTQMGIFVETSANPETTVYNIPTCLKLDSSIDLERLKSAVENAINAHPYLKVKLFTDVDGEVRAKRNDDALPVVEFVKCDSLPSKEKLLKPFYLLKDNLYRAKIFCTKDATYLFLEVHHIAADGESLAIILHDISESYAGKPLETEVFTGYEIALEEETARETKQLKDAEDYYSSVFGGCDPNCFIPKSADECEILGTYGCLEMESSTNLTAVKKVCEKINVSMNAFYLSAFGYLLAKYLYREDSVFTTIYNGRSDSRMANTVDMLVKTLPVYVNIEKNDDVAELCRITQSQFMDSMANDLYSFAEISQKFGIKADIQFIFQGDLFNFDSLCGKPAEIIPLQLNAAKTPLDIKVFIIDDKISYKVEYKSDFYEETFVRHILKNLDIAVKGFSEKQKLSDISLVSEESLKVYDALNDNNVDFNVVSVNKLFENQVRKNPERTAVIVNEESLTYGELNKFANRIAHALIKRGVHKDSIVGMIFDRTKEIFIAEHGILKSGAAFLPMVEEYPDDRISFCLHDAASPFVLTTEKIKAKRATLFEEAKPCQVLTIEELIQEGADGSCDKNPDLEIPVDSLAYCIYTSGSTGRPKGVMLEHRNMCNYVTFNEKNISHYSLVNGIKTSLSVTSIAFDMSITERYISLCNGITLVMATLDEIHNPLQLNQLMLKHKVETIVCTPSFLSSLYDFEELHTSLKNLKAGHIGGENLPDTLVKKIKTLNPEFHLINGYGPTETSVAPTASESEIGHRVMIGRPGPNVKCFVVDKKLNLLPPGMQGELLICGKGVGRGYVNLPEKTKAAFIEYKGCKTYHSGDKVRITSKGILECFGRLDNQVKLRGLRIELDEIENVISSYNKIRLVKVIVRNNDTEDYLAGFFTADTHIDINELKNYLAAKLTPYMIPDALMQLDEMPLNSNGKIDKKALPETTVQFDEAEYVEPANDLEKFFCEVFEKVLKREKIGATENFFKIGGTSLSATRVVNFAISKGYNLVYKNVFKNPTPQLLAKFINENLGADGLADSKNLANGGVAENASEILRTKEIRPALRGNTIDQLDDISFTPLGNVLLAGCTGFLGIHVLKELLNDQNRKIYCLIRKGGEDSLEKRLNTMYFYYFAESLESAFGKQIYMIEGDITEENLTEKLHGYNFTEIINCAACVKHFAADDSIEKVNFHGVENLIKVALDKGAKLIHVSTTSVAGEGGSEFDENFRMIETMCDFGQIHENQYIDSKLKAELAILDAIEQKGLKAKIVRVGNLSSRQKDGEFQINAKTNGFMSRLKAYKILGVFPVELLDSEVEFSPIDYVAKSLVLLGGTPDKFTVFNNRNCHTVHFANIIEACNNFGMKVDIVKQKDFDQILSASLNNEEKTVQVSSLLSYRNNEGKSRHAIRNDNSFTIKALYRLGFSWPITGQIYIQKFLQALEMLGFFDE